MNTSTNTEEAPVATSLLLRTSTTLTGGGTVLLEAAIDELGALAPADHGFLRDLLDVVATHAATGVLVAPPTLLPPVEEVEAVTTPVLPAPVTPKARTPRPRNVSGEFLCGTCGRKRGRMAAAYPARVRPCAPRGPTTRAGRSLNGSPPWRLGTLRLH